MSSIPPSPPAALTPDERERAWLRDTYAGDDARQLTVRAVVTGMMLGAVMAVSNLYVVLKVGWSFGVTITAAILGFGLWSTVHHVLPSPPAAADGVFWRFYARVREPFGPLENNAMQSVTSAAGYMTGGGTAAAIPALMMLTGYRFDTVSMTVWIGTLACLGVFVAVPLKRQLINVEQLPFPTGIASAETVLSLHGEGADSKKKARALAYSALVGGVLPIVKDVTKWVPSYVEVFGRVAAGYTLKVEMSLLLVAAGGLMGTRVTMSTLLGGVVCYGMAAPWARGQGAIPGDVLSYRNIVGWSLWIGSSMMLTAALLSFAFQWNHVKRAFVDLALLVRPKKAGAPDDPMAKVEVPSSWFVGGFMVFGPLTVFLQWFLFAIPPWMGTLTVLLSLVVGIVCARATGETDTTPSSAMGKLVQLLFGGLHPGNITTNLMTAQASAGVAIHAADLLTDLKSGYLLGAKPRHQFFAQFFGVVAGSLTVAPVFRLLVPDASVLGGDKYPSPAALAWGSVAKLLAQGVHSLHPTAQVGLVIGGIVGVVLVLADRAFPKARPYLPSPVALGLSFTMPGWNSISIALGGLAALAFQKGRPALAGLLLVPVASGLVAGESLVGVVVGMVEALK
jgi:OPT family oligopeptide transporter